MFPSPHRFYIREDGISGTCSASLFVDGNYCPRTPFIPYPVSPNLRAERMDSADMSPIFLSPRNRLVTVFGGGQVALRKCRHFKGFRIRVVSEQVLPDLRDLAGEVFEDTIDEENVRRYADGSDIVIAATSDHALNDMIRDTAMALGMMVNSAHGGGDVLIPSTLHRDGWTVCVSSEGNAPAFPPYVIARIDELLDPSYDGMLELLTLLRKDIRGRIPTQPARAEFLAGVLRDDDAWDLLRKGDIEGARRLELRRGGLE